MEATFAFSLNIFWLLFDGSSKKEDEKDEDDDDGDVEFIIRDVTSLKKSGEGGNSGKLRKFR